jgi:hypothetical protein
LDNTQAVDEKGRELLRALNADIQELLERSESGQAPDTLLERLQVTIDHFEVTHPSFTTALSKIATALSNAGI